MDILANDYVIGILLIDLIYRTYEKYSFYFKLWLSLKSDTIIQIDDNSLNEGLMNKYKDL